MLKHEWNENGSRCERCGETRLSPDDDRECPGYSEPVCTTCDPGFGDRCVDCHRTPLEADEERAALMTSAPILSGKYPMMEVVPDVDEFHAKMGLCREVTGPLDEFTSRELIDLANALHDVSREMLRGSNGSGILKDRVALMLEELAEIITGFVHNDREEIIDGNADLVYLCLGNAALFKVRLMEAVRRVHASNMSKTPGQPKPLKGEGYFKPNFEGL